MLMKKMVLPVLLLIFSLSLAGCGNKEEVEPQAKDVQDLIVSNISSNAVQDDNYVNSEVDAERNVVIVKLRDNSSEKQDEFIYNVFAHCTGSTYITYLEEHSMLVFEKAE